MFGHGTILLAEPEESLRDAWRPGLAAMGFQIREATSGGAALDVLLRSEIALVISELYLATRSQPCLVRAARDEPALRRVKILIVSEHAREQDRTWALASGADAYLAKPIRVGRLFQVAARLATSRRQDRADARHTQLRSADDATF